MSGNICRCGAYSNIVEAIDRSRREDRHEVLHLRARAARRPKPRAAAARTPGRQVHRRRHQPARPDEARDRDAGPPGRRQRPRRSTRSSPRRRAACASARWCATPISPPTSACGATTACSSRALLAGASGQLRNKATTAGNLLQRTRCPYFYDTDQPCNKRQPGSGCAAIGGFSRQHRGGRRERRLHRHPSQRHGGGHARARREGGDGRARRRDARRIPIADFHRLPGDTPAIETALQPGELITAVTLPPPIGRHADLPQGARPGLLRVRAGLGRGRRAEGRQRPRRARRRGPQAVAGRSGGGRSCRGAPRPRPAGCWPAPQPTHDNAFKLPLVERTLAAVLAEARG